MTVVPFFLHSERRRSSVSGCESTHAGTHASRSAPRSVGERTRRARTGQGTHPAPVLQAVAELAPVDRQRTRTQTLHSQSHQGIESAPSAGKSARVISLTCSYRDQKPSTSCSNSVILSGSSGSRDFSSTAKQGKESVQSRSRR